MIPARDDILFAAGFYEGEGYCRIHRRQIVVQITQKDPEILRRMRPLFDGHIHHWGNQNACQFVIYGNSAIKFLESIYPFLSERRKRQINNIGLCLESRQENVA